MQRTQAFLFASLLTTTLVALACEKPPNPAAPKRPSFVVDDQTDRITGGGKLGDGRDFATFGFNARSDQGQIEWVQHCLDGVGSGFCSLGSFTFHGSTTVGMYGAPAEDPDHCRTWSGSGEAKFKDGSTADDGFAVAACDFGQPGRGMDFICFTFDLTPYLRSGTLSGGNIQRHEGSPETFENACATTIVVPT
jgi:hypothetical protein